MKQKAVLRYLKIAPRKVRAVAGLIRGLQVNEAEAQLIHESRRPARPLLKLLRSAIANAKNAKKMNTDTLVIEEVRVDGGPMLKRHLPRARGVATPIQKKMSHVTIMLAEKPGANPPRFKITAQKKVKLPPDESRKTGKKKPAGETREAVKKTEKPGFFRRFFRRKSV